MKTKVLVVRGNREEIKANVRIDMTKPIIDQVITKSIRYSGCVT